MQFTPTTQALFQERKTTVDDFLLSNLTVEDETLQEALLHLPKAGGKRLRPLVFLLSAETLGEQYKPVIPVAAAIEALHTSSLIQDDDPTMDNHAKRRGVQTLHTKYSPAVSTLVSNILHARSTAWCAQIPKSKPVVEAVLAELDNVVRQMSTGQHADLRYGNAAAISNDEYLEMVRQKTARIYSGAAQLGAIVAEEDDMKEDIAAYGEALGIAFQMTDDVLDFRGDDTGKETYADLRQHKKTAVTLHAKNSGYPIFSDDYTIDERAAMIREAGSVEFAREQAQTYANAAQEALEAVDPVNQEAYEALQEIAEQVAGRNY